jgi:hypothetical protein
MNTVQEHLCTYVSRGESYLEEGEVIGFAASAYFLFACGSCDEVLLYEVPFEYDEDIGPEAEEILRRSFIDEDDVYEPRLMWPRPKRETVLHKSVPQSVQDCYRDAASVRNSNPNAYAVMIRRALEVICRDQGLRGNTLHEQLEDLGSRKNHPPVLAEIGKEPKRLGNIGAHADEKRIDKDEVVILDRFFRLVLDYIYVIPTKVIEVADKLEGLSNDPARSKSDLIY